MRAYLARRKFEKVRRGIVLLQAHVRRRAAKKVFKELKVKFIIIIKTNPVVDFNDYHPPKKNPHIILRINTWESNEKKQIT